MDTSHEKEIVPKKMNYINRSLIEDSGLMNIEKKRTPSGNEISQSVQEVRGIFSPNNNNMLNPKRKRNTSSELPTHIKKLIRGPGVKRQCKQVQSTVAKKIKKKASMLARSRHASMDNYITKSVSSSYEDISNSDMSISQHSIAGLTDGSVTTEELYQLAGQLKEVTEDQLKAMMNKTSSPKHGEAILSPSRNSKQMETDLKNNMYGVEDAAMKDAGVLSVTQMYTDLKGLINKLQDDVQKLQRKDIDQATVDKWSKKVIDKVNRSIDKTCNQDQEEISKLKKDLKHFKFRNRALTEVVDRMSVEMEDLKSKIENIELSGSRKAISMTGFVAQGKKHEMIRLLETFFEETMGLFVTIEDAYKLGNLTIVYFQSIYDKRDVMRFKYLLKNYRNGENKPVFINDYLPAATQEKRRFEQQIFKANEGRDPPFEIGYVKGKLTIQGETYRKKVNVPSPKDLVDIDPHDLAEILKMDLQSGGIIHQEKSVFEGFTASMSSYQQIRRLYIKIKLMQPSARHIACVYYRLDPVNSNTVNSKL